MVVVHKNASVLTLLKKTPRFVELQALLLPLQYLLPLQQLVLLKFRDVNPVVQIVVVMPKDVSQLEETTRVVVMLTLVYHSFERVTFVRELLNHTLEWIILIHRNMTPRVFGIVNLFGKHLDDLLFKEMPIQKLEV